MILYFDTETTGLHPGGIIQLAYIMQTKEQIIAKNFFCFNPYIDPFSSQVHGITVPKLAKLSGGLTFYDHFEQIEQDFKSASLLVAHNFPFDFKFMHAEFERCNATFTYQQKLDTMRHFCSATKIPNKSGKGYKYPKLCELATHFEIYDYDATMLAIKLFKNTGSSHDARFDIAQTFLCVQKAEEELPDFANYLNQYK